MYDRNAEDHFGHIEATNIKRSKFNMTFRNLSTCNAGLIIPFFVYSDVLPGDTIKINTNAVVRMQTPLNPTMDDAFVDTYYFAIPHRLVWEHWKEFMGESKDSAWVSSTTYTVPQMYTTSPTGRVLMGTICDYMGIPKVTPGLYFSALPIRAYVLTYNTWFRNQNLIAPLTENVGDSNIQSNSTSPVTGGYPCKASKIPDYFTTCLPDAQKGTPTPIPLGTSAPVMGDGKALGLYDGTNTEYLFKGTTGNSNYRTLMVSTTSGNAGATTGQTLTGGTANTFEGITTDATKSGLIADLTSATAATINALRLYFQVQKLKELGARGGTRYFEVIKSEFGTAPNMSALQYPEYLGGRRTPLNITQVVQESSTVNNTQALGETGGMSHTVFSNEDFTKSFQEHTIILGLMVIRQYHTYQQGLHRMWSRTQKLDYYTPILAHLGEQPVYKKEIYAMGSASGSTDDQVFGYQERWAEYKYGNQIITGEMNSTYTTPLDKWHYGDKYASSPTLAQNWIEEIPDYIDRTIAVTSSTSHQFKFDIVTNMTAVRPMPVYCTPGLIDHF